MRTLLMAATATLALCAQSAQAQSVFDACEPDIKQHCETVTPGNGRLSACLYAHEDQLSESCDAAFGEVGDVLDLVFERLRYVSQQCGEDLRKFCSETELGQGRKFVCLHSHKSELSAECGEVIDGVQLPADN